MELTKTTEITILRCLSRCQFVKDSAEKFAGEEKVNRDFDLWGLVEILDDICGDLSAVYNHFAELPFELMQKVNDGGKEVTHEQN